MIQKSRDASFFRHIVQGIRIFLLYMKRDCLTIVVHVDPSAEGAMLLSRGADESAMIAHTLLRCGSEILRNAYQPKKKEDPNLTNKLVKESEEFLSHIKKTMEKQ
jgi:hypothetical protein